MINLTRNPTFTFLKLEVHKFTVRLRRRISQFKMHPLRVHNYSSPKQQHPAEMTRRLAFEKIPQD
jgi:hypothetical protein